MNVTFLAVPVDRTPPAHALRRALPSPQAAEGRRCLNRESLAYVLEVTLLAEPVDPIPYLLEPPSSPNTMGSDAKQSLRRGTQ